MVDTDLLRLLLRGSVITLQVTGLSVVLGTVLGVLGGVSSLSERRWIRWVTTVYVELFRGVAALILLYIAAFAIPQALGIRPAGLAFYAGVVALGTNMGAYGTEIARGAINAIPRGQTEAGIAVNLTKTQRYRYVILPQALITMLPPYGNLIIEVLKASALVSAIGLRDIMQEGQILRGLPGGPSSAEIFGLGLVLYFLISLGITAMVRIVERLSSRGREVASSARVGAR